MVNKQQRVCVFCGSNELTSEHIFPNWMSKLFSSSTNATTLIERKDIVENSFVSKVFQQKTRMVCQRCNNGWMSRLESDVKPILQHLLFDLNYSSKLGHEEQALIAFWAQKTVMILCKSTGADYSIPRESYEKLFQTQSPINDISVRLGWRIPKNGKHGPHLAHFTISQIRGSEPERHKELLDNAEVWRVIIAIGNIVFHISGCTSNIKIELCNNDDRVMVQIFPYVADINWPTGWPVDALTSIGFEEFSKC